MNILVTGANGQLGNEMRVLASRQACHPRSDRGPRFLFTDVTDASEESVAMLRKLAGPGVDVSTRKLDITDLDAIRAAVREEGIDAIVNCAAYTNVDAAEDNFALAELLNATAPGNLAAAMQETGGLLVHISTDYVFGGDPYNTPCREDQTGTPTGVYGLTKLHGEQAIQASGCRYAILRTAWLYSEFGKNFVRTMLRLTAEKPQLKVVFDQVGTPTYAGDLANAIGVILSSFAGLTSPSFTGIYHFSNEGVCSWYDFTKAIAALAGHESCDIQPCHSDEFPSKVHRPAYSVLDKTKIKETFGLKIPYWTEPLAEVIRRLSSPNSITTAVIMAAGLGTRFGAQTELKPKGFIPFKGIPMVERSIRTLQACGIKRIIIGTGYHKEYYESLTEKYPGIECVFSPRFAETNSMYTLWNCRESIGDADFLLLESDLVFERKAISGLLECPFDSAMLITPVTKFQDQYYVQMNERCELINCSVNREEINPSGELVGIHKISNRFYRILCSEYEKIVDEKPKLGYEFELLDVSQRITPMNVLKMDRLQWYEIDDEQDLKYAEEKIEIQ